LPAGALDGLCPACLLAQGVTVETGPETAPFQPPTVAEVARLFPQLEILAFIGKGGMGAVYKARQPGLDRLVALKILPPQVATGPAFAERFNREARALAKLSHPNIVAVHEFGQVNGLPFFLMEFVDGLNLRQLERTRKLSAREALQIVPQICEALQFAHDEGIVHRDIKPDNILLDKRGRVKIADFGIAKLMGRDTEVDLTATKGIIGTPNYMAPEQVEKPETVDHRADIFALGVVFYEMLTGELPLGRFAPPSSGRVEVDVRLDEVVLRALEKKPELRYQQANQVKTAVETIAGDGGGTGHSTAPSAADAEALVQDILAREYTLNITSCLRRGWALVRSNFWPMVGISALIWVLLAIAQSAGVVIASDHDRTNGGGSILGLLVSGPLMAGLYFYFLQKIRGQPVTIETAFAGFSRRFLHLFLGSFVSLLLTGLGFLCLILPGIYLWIAWTFTLPLIMDRRLDFWSAMELSRKMVTRHWWKLFGFVLLLGLLHVAGFLVFCLGILIAAPIATASLMYAYEDMFGGSGRLADQPAGVGPHGTAVLGGSPAKPSATGGSWKPAMVVGLGAAALLIAVISVIAIANFIRHRGRVAHERAVAAQQASDAQRAAAVRRVAFGPFHEVIIQARSTGTNQFLDLDTGKLRTPSSEISSALAAQPGEDENRLWQALDIPPDSERFRYVAWLRESGTDLMFAGEGKIIGFDGVFPIAHGNGSANWDGWDGLPPGQVFEAVNGVGRGPSAQPGPTSGGIVNSAAQLDSQQADGPVVNLLNREQSELWFFQTREGAKGVLQIMAFTDDPSGVKIRYRLVQSGKAESTSHEDLAGRLEAAANISGDAERDAALANLARDAAKSGEAEFISETLQQIRGSAERDQAALESVRLLARQGLRKPAIEIAKSIAGSAMRDQALSELAR
jgi:predicted Ser/Thr protein kinase